MQKRLWMVLGSPESGKTTWIKDFFLKQNTSAKYIHENNKTCELLLSLVNNKEDIIIDGENSNNKLREKFSSIARHKGYRIIYICFKNHPKYKENYFRSYFDEPTKDEYHEIIYPPRISKVLDLSGLAHDRRYIVVGDLHGRLEELQILLNRILFNEKDVLICSGDCINKKEHSLKTLDWFMKNNYFLVMGNHESKLLRYLQGSNTVINSGMEETINDLKLSSIGVDQYIQYLANIPQIIRLPNINNAPQYVVHAAIDPDIPISVQKYETSLYGKVLNRHNWKENIKGQFRVICGHRFSESPFDGNDVVCLEGDNLRALINGKEIIEI